MQAKLRHWSWIVLVGVLEVNIFEDIVDSAGVPSCSVLFSFSILARVLGIICKIAFSSSRTMCLAACATLPTHHLTV